MILGIERALLGRSLRPGLLCRIASIHNKQCGPHKSSLGWTGTEVPHAFQWPFHCCAATGTPTGFAVPKWSSCQRVNYHPPAICGTFIEGQRARRCYAILRPYPATPQESLAHGKLSALRRGGDCDGSLRYCADCHDQVCGVGGTQQKGSNRCR